MLSNGDVLEVVFDFDSDAILLGYPRYAEHTERLHRHHWKVKNSSVPAMYRSRSQYSPWWRSVPQLAHKA